MMCTGDNPDLKFTYYIQRSTGGDLPAALVQRSIYWLLLASAISKFKGFPFPIIFPQTF